MWNTSEGKSKASQMSHFSKQFTRNYFYWSKQRNPSVLRAKQENREDWWFAGASVPAKHSTRSIRCATSTEKCLPCLGKRAFPAAVEAAPLPCQTQVNLFPRCLCQQDPNPQELPYCFVLQLLQEVLSWMPRHFQDLGQLVQVWQAVLKITLWGANPTPAQPARAQWAHDTNSPQSYKQRFIRLAKRAPSLSSWNGISINRSFFWCNHARTHIHGLGRMCKDLGMEPWPHKVEQLVKNHATTEVHFWGPLLFSSPKRLVLVITSW